MDKKNNNQRILSIEFCNCVSLSRYFAVCINYTLKQLLKKMLINRIALTKKL